MALVTRRSRLGDVMAAANPVPPGTGTTATSQASGASPPQPPTDAAAWWTRAAIVAIVGVVAGAAILGIRNPPLFSPGTGISAFAPLYVIAQAIERFLEPVKKILAKQPQTGVGNKATATAKRNAAVAEAATSPHPADAGLSDTEKTQNVAGRVEAAAQAQRELDDLQANRTAILWGVSTALAMIACGYFGVGLLHAIGETGSPRYVDMFVTGLAVGGGTKPLHDFISNLQSSSQQKSTPQPTA
jgi:hypothetical protein